MSAVSKAVPAAAGQLPQPAYGADIVTKEAAPLGIPDCVFAVGSGRRTGLVMVQLSCVPLAEAVRTYLAIQAPRLAGMGLTGDVLVAYAEYLVRYSMQSNCSGAVIDADGTLCGLMMYFDAPHEPAPELSDIAKEHRELALALGRRACQLCTHEHMLEIVFGGVLPSHQGKGLMGWMEHVTGRVALDCGFKSFWSWTLNPLMMKAQGNSDPSMKLLSSMAAQIMKLPASVINNAVLPSLGLVGVVPRTHRFCVVPMADFPILVRAGVKLDVAVAVVPFNADHRGEAVNGEALAAEEVARQLARLAANAALSSSTSDASPTPGSPSASDSSSSCGASPTTQGSRTSTDSLSEDDSTAVPPSPAASDKGGSA